ncbi:MAG: hypothetical protein ACFCUR_20355 [Rhodomicrobiaceae bacterium]
MENGRSSRRNWVTADGSYPIHPFMFAIVSVLAMLANGLDHADYADIVPALGGSLAFALTALLLAGAVIRRLDARTAVIASIWIVGSLYYASLFDDINKLLGGGFSMVNSLAVSVPVLVGLTIAAARVRFPLNNVNLILNCIAVVMLVTPVWNIAVYEWRYGAARNVYDPVKAAEEMPEIAASGATADSAAKRPPDIYHFIFDRYTSESVLTTHYDLDNSAIGRFLEERGFHVARESNSNYQKTGHSLASTFYMDYLDLLADDDRLAPKGWHPIYAMLDDHRVARFLKNRGYDFIQFGSWWGGTFHNPLADENHPHGFSEFNMLYLRKTILRPLFHIMPDSDFTSRLDWDNGQCGRVANQIEQIKAIGQRDKSVYVFTHILVPHGPYNFATDGRCLSIDESLERGEPQGYIDQIAYANRIIEEIVPALQAPDREPPVILIQSDEGPFPRKRDYSVPWQDSPAHELQIKTGILNAYYFPDQDYSMLSDDTTSVNTYRILFNHYFGTEFPLLPDRVFAFPDPIIYEFHDVTENVRGAADAPASSQIN